MATNHRGQPVSDNHRSYPRVEAMIRRELAYGGRNVRTDGSDIVKSHQTKAPISLGGGAAGAVSGPVYTDMPAKINPRLERELVEHAGSRDGLGDAMSARIASQNELHDVNSAVAGYGGTEELIYEAFKNRHKNRKREQKQLDYENEEQL